MASLLFSSFFLLAFAFCVLASPKSRVMDEELSKEKHYDHEAHNPEYDHEAFLGKQEARVYEELTPEQSKQRLGKLFHKVDKDADGQVSESELKQWIKFTQQRYIYEDAERQLKANDLNLDGRVEWEEYRNATYGFVTQDDEHVKTYKEMINRDKRRFLRADKNADNQLNADEFTAFLHPENNDDMKGIVVDETLEDIDKDKDGFISLSEYIGDLWPEEERAKGTEPEWVKTEKQQFSVFRDKNKDGRMDREEVADWIMPEDFDHVTAEARHLIQESDTNKDGQVSKEEMVEKFDLYVGSQATDFGEALKRDEL